jgi:phage tail sheath gpL-like
MIAAWVTPATNSDAYFGGTSFTTRGGVPLNLPAQRIRPTRSTANAAVVDALEPWTVARGKLGVLRGRNASTASEQQLWDPSYIRQQDYQRRDLKTDGAATFTNPKVKADGILNQPGEISTASVRGWAIGRMQVWEQRGVFDGAEQLKGAVVAEIDSQYADRINLFVPSSPVIMTHQFLVVLGRSAPAI